MAKSEDMRSSTRASKSDAAARWSDYWTSDGAAGEVFVNPQGERHPALAAHWQQVFAGVQDGARVIDLASGAGSIFAQLPEHHGFELHAADISAEALRILEQRVPGTATVACSADSVPCDDGAFDLVVSQFGIEYAGIDAFSEAARLVGRDGRLALLCHYAGGYVDSRNAAELAAAELADDCHFVDKAIAVTMAAYGDDTAEQRRTVDDFIPAEKKMAVAVEQLKHGVHVHLYLGFRKLFEERRDYAASDITTWLGQMRGELERSIDRLTRMRGAALSRADMDRVAEMLAARGLRGVSVVPFNAVGNDLPVAWNVAATRD